MNRPKKIAVSAMGLVLVAAVVFATTRFLREPLTPLQTKSEFLDTAIEDANRRIELVDELIVALIDGRASLDQVARDFLKLHENQRGFAESHAANHAGQTPLERAARDMANRAYFRAHPHQQQALARRLTDEFRVLFPEMEPLQFDLIVTPRHNPRLVRQPGGRNLPVPVDVPYE